ncbi:MAG: Single-stranded DNA-binding protein [Dehalococcoidia bacterium]|nr:Single-stranded DNA-binding protein [Chloroflexota bacterium]MBT9166198.1 Single-stranded DNA-binding protein [Chloroflexota bacterium]
MTGNISILGTLGKTPEALHYESGTIICEFSIAVNRKVKGEQVTDWWAVKSFGKTAEIIGQYFEKGHQILIHGELTQDHWADKSTGEKRTKPVIIVNSFDFVERRSDSDRDQITSHNHSSSSERSQQSSYTSPKPPTVDLDEVPF